MAYTWLEWSVWINFENFQKPRMWEYINQYVSSNTLDHSGAKKEKNSPHDLNPKIRNTDGGVFVCQNTQKNLKSN